MVVRQLSWWELLLGLSLAAWWATTIAVQFGGRRSRALRKMDLFGMLPDWRFFAPYPATTDYHLLHRYRLADGTVTFWSESSPRAPRHGLVCLWNPGRRLQKAIFDLVTLLGAEVGSRTALPLQLSVPYLLLLNFVARHDAPPNACATQFAIVAYDRRDSTDQGAVVLVSDVHDL